MKIIGIIPARLASSRFPNKPMADIHGMPMIGHCYFRSKICELLNEVYVATCDLEIFDYITSIGGNAIMTSNTHERASDRSAEALLKIEKAKGEKIDIVVMLQGDEPMVTPDMIELAVQPLIDDVSIKVSNLYSNLRSTDEFEDPNEVKVVIDKNGNALYFSREPIPSRKKGAITVTMFKQVCIIPFKRDFLLEFNNLRPTPLEIIESVDMLRVLENGLNVKMIFCNNESYSVDTPKDLEKVNSIMKDDKLMKLYN